MPKNERKEVPDRAGRDTQIVTKRGKLSTKLPKSCQGSSRINRGNCAAVKTLAHDKCNKLLPPQRYSIQRGRGRLRKLIKRRRLDIFITTKQKKKKIRKGKELKDTQPCEEFVNCHFSGIN